MRDALPRHSLVFAVAAALFALSWAGAGPVLQSGPAVLILAGIVLVLGLPHGALDLWLAGRSHLFGEGARFSPHGFVVFHLVYLALAAVVVLAFVVVPTLALIGFLVLSLWHFSDDWRGLRVPVRLGCASIIVLVPTLFHPTEVASIFAAISGREVARVEALPYELWMISSWLIGGSMLGAYLADRWAALEVGVLVALGALLPPLAFFSAYFVLLHGPRHMMRHARLLDGPRARPILLAYTLVALGIVAGLGWLLAAETELSVTADAMRALFVGLAALTVPHAILVEHDKRHTGCSAG